MFQDLRTDNFSKIVGIFMPKLRNLLNSYLWNFFFFFLFDCFSALFLLSTNLNLIQIPLLVQKKINSIKTHISCVLAAKLKLSIF